VKRSYSKSQRGAAILTALLVVMLVATTVTYLLAQQSQLLTRTARTISQTQATLYAQPVIDWARSAMLEDQQKSTNDHLKEAWGQGLVALPIENAVASGVIHDETAMFNLNNLVDDANSAEDKKVFRRLLTNLKLNPDLANAIVDWIDKDSEVTSLYIVAHSVSSAKPKIDGDRGNTRGSRY
jgi:general secretion pathway protein K